jgi:uncharacterized protein YidB (DUF937 family)
MGLLDSLVGALGQTQGQVSGHAQGQPDLLNAVIGMLGNGSPVGGLAGLAAKFQQGGLGEVLQSWVSTGQNLPISPDQLQSVLGADTLATLARQFGLNAGDVAGPLSQLLPQVVDRLTPQGQMPQGGLGGAADLLAAFMKR